VYFLIAGPINFHYNNSMKNKNPLEKAMNNYDIFIENVLSLPFDVRTDVLKIAEKYSKNPYMYLFNRVQKRDVNDPIYGLLLENGLLTNEMLQN
jgi:hypothetical protein